MTATKEKSPRKPRKKSAAEYVHENVMRDEARDAERAAESIPLPVMDSQDDHDDADEEPTGARSPATAHVYHVGLKLIKPSKLNPRFTVNQARVLEIAASMADPAIRQLQYPIARRLEGGMYELLTGRHRFEAAKHNGWATMLLDVRELDDMKAVEIATMENMQRADMHPLEEAIGIDNMIKAGWSLAAIAANLGKSVQWVARRHSLAKLSESWQLAIRRPEQFDTSGDYFQVKNFIGRLSAAHYEVVARMPAEIQEAKFEEIRQFFHGAMHEADALAHRMEGDERRLDNATFLSEDAEITRRLGDVSTCATCPKQTGAAPLLFHDETAPSKKRKGQSEDRCLDGACWARKEAAFVQIRIEAAKEKHGDEVVCVADTHLKPARELGKIARKATGTSIVQRSQLDGSFDDKPSRGAKPAIVADGPRAGQTVWVKVKPERSAPKASKNDPMAEIKAKRDRWIAEAIKDQLKHAAKHINENISPGSTLMIAIAGMLFYRPDEFLKVMKKIDAGRATAAEVLIELSISDLLHYHNEHFTGKALQMFLSVFIQFPGEWDLKVLEAKAAEEFPDPEPGAAKPSKKKTGKKKSRR